MLVESPVDAQAVLLLLHASFAPAVVQWALLECFQGAAALVPPLGADVALLPRYALPHSPILGAASRLLQAELAGPDAVHPAGRSEHGLLR